MVQVWLQFEHFKTVFFLPMVSKAFVIAINQQIPAVIKPPIGLGNRKSRKTPATEKPITVDHSSVLAFEPHFGHSLVSSTGIPSLHLPF